RAHGKSILRSARPCPVTPSAFASRLDANGYTLAGGLMTRVLAAVGATLVLAACGAGAPVKLPLAGDWDFERMLGASPNGGVAARGGVGGARFQGACAP